MAAPLPFGVLPTQSLIQAALRNFLQTVLPPSVEIILAQPNYVAEPQGSDFVVMTPLRFERIETNIDTTADAKFVGSITGGVLTVSQLLIGTVNVGATIWGTGVTTTVLALLSGIGGTGTYTVSGTGTVPSQIFSGGAKAIQQNAMVTIQLDFHSANETNSGDYAQLVATTFRDEYGVTQFASQGLPYEIAPLYADDPKQMPFENAEQVVEWRWVLEAVLQANQTITVPQQYADSLVVDVQSVYAEFPH